MKGECPPGLPWPPAPSPLCREVAGPEMPDTLPSQSVLQSWKQRPEGKGGSQHPPPTSTQELSGLGPARSNQDPAHNRPGPVWRSQWALSTTGPCEWGHLYLQHFTSGENFTSGEKGEGTFLGSLIKCQSLDLIPDLTNSQVQALNH